MTKSLARMVRSVANGIPACIYGLGTGDVVPSGDFSRTQVIAGREVTQYNELTHVPDYACR